MREVKASLEEYDEISYLAERGVDRKDHGIYAANVDYGSRFNVAEQIKKKYCDMKWRLEEAQRQVHDIKSLINALPGSKHNASNSQNQREKQAKGCVDCSLNVLGLC